MLESGGFTRSCLLGPEDKGQSAAVETKMAYGHHEGPLRYAAARAYSSIQEDKLGQLVGI